MTDIEILKDVIDTLNGISVPTVLMEQIGVPLYNANCKLRNLYGAIIQRISAEQKNDTESNHELKEIAPEDIPEGATVVELPVDEK